MKGGFYLTFLGISYRQIFFIESLYTDVNFDIHLSLKKQRLADIPRINRAKENISFL
jgi:hypothetical protein